MLRMATPKTAAKSTTPCFLEEISNKLGTLGIQIRTTPEHTSDSCPISAMPLDAAKKIGRLYISDRLCLNK